MDNHFKNQMTIDQASNALYTPTRHFCSVCCNTGSIWASREKMHDAVVDLTLGRGWKAGLELYRFWKQEHCLPCPEGCR